MSQLTLRQSRVLRSMVNARDRLASFMGYTHGHQRDLYATFGWKRQLLPQDYMACYKRNPIANRIIRAFPQATWENEASVSDETGTSHIKDTDEYSPFTESAYKLFKRARVVTALERADRLSSIGQYGILVMGFQDGLPLDAPMLGRAPLIYLQSYAEVSTNIHDFEKDTKSPRFGRPLYYTVQAGSAQDGRTSVMRSFRVHWTRCLHMSEFLDEDIVYGTPRLQPVFNYLQDLDKVLGGSAETFWLNARPGLALTTETDTSFEEEDREKMKEQVSDFEHQLTRILALEGVTPTPLNAQVADPEPNADKLLEAISGGAGIPKRILVGSERGELSSTSDDDNWDSRIAERKRMYAGPQILVPFVQKMIETGNIVEPSGEWDSFWPESAADPDKLADLGTKRTTMLSQYTSNPNAELVVPVGEFRSLFLGLEPESEFEDSGIFDEQRQAAQDARDMLAEGGPPSNDNEEKDKEETSKKIEANILAHFAQLRANAAPRTLYVKRPVVNASDLLSWAKGQGLTDLVSADDLHCTVIYSKAKVDWMKARAPWDETEDAEVIVRPGGPRLVDAFGEDKKSIVLLFANQALEWRHTQLREMGCSFDFSEYQPHITLTYTGTELDLASIEPYQGEIVLGPEKFEEIVDSWSEAAE